MQVTGIIVEYNPFHNGHLYHILQAKKRTHAQILIACMSGNWVQRGEPACLDKWIRAEIALKNGVDIVVELPTSFSLQSADYFGKGAVEILSKLGCQSLVFGTDQSEQIDYATFGMAFQKRKAEFERKLQEFVPKTLAYPEKMAQVVGEMFPEIPVSQTSPNHNLALSYAKSNALLKEPMQMVAVTRKSTNFHEMTLSQPISSATAIRAAVLKGEMVKDVVPKEVSKFLKQDTLHDWEKFFPFLHYKIETSTKEQLAQIYQMREGLENRLKKSSHASSNFEEFLKEISTKRYTAGRLKRQCCYVLGNIFADEIAREQNACGVRVLGFTSRGQQYLHQIKKEKEIQLVTKFTKEDAFVVTRKMDALYQLATHAEEQNIGRIPIRVG